MIPEHSVVSHISPCRLQWAHKTDPRLGDAREMRSTMTHQSQACNEASIRRYYEEVDKSPENVISMFAEYANYDRPGYKTMLGKESIAEFYRSKRLIQGGTHHIRRLVSSGSLIVAEGVFEGTLHSNQEVKVGFVDLFEMDDALIINRRTYFHTATV